MDRIRKGLLWLLVFPLLCGTLLCGCVRDENAVLIGVSDSAHEQILGWMVRELAVRQGIECQVQEVSPGIANIQPALENNVLQVGIEYSQSAWRNVLEETTAYSAGDLSVLQSRYQDLGLYWYNLPMVDDHYSLAVSRSLAQANQLSTLSDLAKISDTLVLGASTSFFEEADGYPLLSSAYDMEFRTTRNLPQNGLVDAVLNRQVDVIPAHSLDGELARTEFIILEDDQMIHDDTTAGIVITKDALMKYPQLADIAHRIARVLRGSQLASYAQNVVIGNATAQKAALQLLKAKELIYEPQPAGALPALRSQK